MDIITFLELMYPYADWDTLYGVMVVLAAMTFSVSVLLAHLRK